MRRFYKLLFGYLVLSVLFVSGCATQSGFQSSGPKFREESFTDVVIQFHNWESILVLRPDYRDNGFRRQFTRDELSQLLQSKTTRHELAAVVVSEACTGEWLNEIMADWQTLLQGCGFKRVVFLKAGMGDGINGLAILHDSETGYGMTSS